MNYRLKHGWSLEEALEGKESSAIVTDHKGNKFVSQKQMCSHYGVAQVTFYNRLSRGWSLEEALEGKAPNFNKSTAVTDHKGNKFKSERQMCKHYGVGISLFNYRLKHGWSLEEALEGRESSVGRGIPVTDHNGNKFDSKKQMCDYYGVGVSLFNYRLKHGWSLEEALEGKKKR